MLIKKKISRIAGRIASQLDQTEKTLAATLWLTPARSNHSAA
jgi:hypothetical protein